MTSRTATFTPTAGFAPDAVYSARLAGGSSDPRIEDVSGNALAADALWSFTTHGLPTTFVDTSVADFSRGTLDASGYIGAAADGELMLAPLAGSEFSGTTLSLGVPPAIWASSPWSGTPSVTMGGGLLNVDGAFVSTNSLYGGSLSLEFAATFTGAPYQHAGFAVTLSTGAWAMFSSSGGDGLYARSNNGGGQAPNTLIPGNWFGAQHRFGIVWTPSSVVYFIDGAQVASHGVSIGGTMRPMASDYEGDGDALTIDWMRMTPYAAASAYLSGIFDATGTATWTTATWTGAAPAGTAVVLSVRSGDAAVPNATWTPFTVVTGPIDVTARYLQYRLQLSSTVSAQTPVVHDVAIDLKR